MENFTFVGLGGMTIRKTAFPILLFALIFPFSGMAFEHAHPTDKNPDIAIFDVHGSLNLPGLAWDISTVDCDGDGVSCDREKKDDTDPNDPCDFILASQDCEPSPAWKKADCDGDGVTNGQEKNDGTDPLDSCDLIPAHQTCGPTQDWKKMDCDGDGVPNGQEKKDGTDPLDPCEYRPEHVTLPQGGAYLTADCDGDGVSNGTEMADGTDPNDPCDFILEHQDCTPSKDWKKMDCDGDGVPNGQEKKDGTNPLDPCEYRPEHVTLPQGGAYLTADCDGDGVPNGQEKEDGTDPFDPCDFKLGSQSMAPSPTWNSSDCDGDGVPNGQEKEDGTDPLDPCDYRPESVTLVPTADWETLDCDGDGNPNGPDPNPLAATAVDDFGDTAPLTQVSIDILANDDFLPNNDSGNMGVTALSNLGGTAMGTIVFDASTGLMQYTPVLSESNSTVTVVYQVCNVLIDPNVCASATVHIKVGANALDAVDDLYDHIAGTLGPIADSNVLLNDTLNGIPVVAADMVLSSTPTQTLTVNADGSVTVAPGTPAGSYTIDYTLCELANMANCDTAKVTVVVQEASNRPIDAVDDTYTLVGNAGGVVPDSNVLSNDTLDGEPVSLENIILDAGPGVALSIEADGSVRVDPGTPAGTYTIDYTICEIADVGNCDSATVTVVVSTDMPKVIDAVDDFFTVEGTQEGGEIPGSQVLTNDTLDGAAVTLESVILTSDSNGVLTINPDGSVSVAPGTMAGTYTLAYTLCVLDDQSNCDTATVTVLVEAADDGTNKVEVNQMLTPNGDLKNDFLFIRGVEKIKASTFTVFNRWGKAVYQGENYDNIHNVFDGRSRGRGTINVNEYLPAGVYFYIFNYETDEGSFTDSEYIYLSR